MTMTTTIQKWGNSSAVRLPKPIMEASLLKDNDSIEIIVEAEAIILKKPTRRRAKKSLKERLEEFYGKPIDEIMADDTLYNPVEVDWGPPVGLERWWENEEV